MSSSTQEMWLEIRLLSDWRIGAAAADAPDVDDTPVTTPEGLPVIPGKALRGLLRAAMREATTLAKAIGTDAAKPDPRAIEACFGSEIERVSADKREQQLEERRLQTTPGRVHVGNAELGRGRARAAWRAVAVDSDGKPAAWLPELRRRIASTRIDEDGVAADQSLRAAHVFVPMTLYAPLQLLDPTDDPATNHADVGDWKRWIRCALPLITELGSQRTRGLGEVIVREVAALPASSDAADTSCTSSPAGTSAWLRLELLDDVLVTQTGASGHEASEYLPGSLLLGAAAARCYGALAEDAFAAFHTGSVRFGDALPMIAGVQARPMPRTLHLPKGGASDVAHNIAAGPLQDGHQWSALGGGWLAPDGRRVAVDASLSMRTAINDLGAPMDGLLYTLTTIQRGQVFVARVDADVEHAATRERILSALDGKILHLGGSRGAEFGRCHASRLTADAEDPGATWQQGELATEHQVVVWCLSDVCLVDAHGGPRLLPAPEDVGLAHSAWKLDAGRSQLRSRRYSPFHGYRGRPAMEREVICAGSVWTFVPADGRRDLPDPDAIARATAAGIGLHRAEGLGQVAVQPALLCQAQMPLAANKTGCERSVPRDQQGAREILNSDKSFAAWTARAAERSRQRQLLEAAQKIARELRAFDLPRSQLGALRAFAIEHKDLDVAAFQARFAGQFDAGTGQRADVAPAPSRAGSRDDDNRRRVRDAARAQDAEVGGGMQRQRWLALRRGKHAADVIRDGVNDWAKRADVRRGDVGTLVALIASRTARLPSPEVVRAAEFAASAARTVEGGGKA